MTKYELTKEFIEAVGVEGKLRFCNLSRISGFLTCKHPHEIWTKDYCYELCKSCEHHLLEKPTLTADKILELEGLILKARPCFNIDFYEDGVNKDIYKYTSIWDNKIFISAKHSRPEALQELIIELVNAEVLGKEEVKRILENV